jgi:hypothetical protein
MVHFSDMLEYNWLASFNIWIDEKFRSAQQTNTLLGRKKQGALGTEVQLLSVPLDFLA